MAEISSEKIDSNKFLEENMCEEKNDSCEKKRKYSSNSLKSDSFFNNLNAEIKSFIENEADISFSSNSNSECQEQQANLDYLLDSKYWRTNKDFSIENENQNEKEIFLKKKNIFLLNDNEKEPIKLFDIKNKYKKEQAIISEGSNKQSTQSNEDEETRIEHLHNISDSDSNNSPLNSLLNNESDENEINCDKLSNKDEKQSIENSNNEKEKGKINIDINKNNNFENKNLIGSNLLLNGFNFANDNLKFKNDTDFGFPYEPINYIQNPNKNISQPFFSGSYLNQPLCPFNSNYNLPSPLSARSIISINSNNSNKINNNYSENNEEENNKIEKKLNINGQNNKFFNFNIHDYNKKLNQNQKDIIDLPLIINQNNNQNVNYNCSKLNLNMTYYPKIQNAHITNHKQSIDKISHSSNYLPELNNRDIPYNLNNNLSEKKIKNNNLNYEEQNNSILTNNINSFNNLAFNNKLKINYKNIISNKNMNNIMNKSSLKGEKQILNLDDIVTGKDNRTTVMIRNIPIKYTDEILNEALVDFHGKYDCLYMPYDYEKKGNKGYAFINFVNPLHILYFYEKFNGKKWVHFESSKICELNCAHFQGVSEIQKHAKNFKDLKKTSYYSGKEENMIIPSKYLLKLKKRFPKMQYTENKAKKILIIKSFE